MGVVRREGIFNAIIYYSGIVLGYFTMVILLPKVLHDDQFGLIRILIPYASMMAFFYLVGMPNSMVRFFPYLKNEKKGHHGILFFAFSIATVSIVIVTVIFLLFKPRLIAFYSLKAALLVHYYYILFPLAIGITFFEILNSYCRAQLKTNFATFLNEVYVRILVLIIAVLYFYHLFDFQTFLYLFVVAYASNAVIMLFYVWSQKMLYMKPDLSVFKPELRKQMLSYGFFNFFQGTTGMLIDKLDFIFIPGLLSLGSAGIYGVAALLAGAVALPAKALLNILYPITAEAFKANDMVKLKALYKSSSSIQLFVGAFLFMLIFVNYDSFFTLIHPGFLVGKYAFMILATGRLFDMATGINGALIMNSKFYKFDLGFTFVLISLTLIANRVLIPIYGLNGAAIATSSAFIIYNTFKTVFVLITLKLQPFDWTTIKILLTIGAICAISFFLPASSNAMFDILYKSTLISFLFLMSILYLNLSPEIYDTIIVFYKRGKTITKNRFGKR